MQVSSQQLKAFLLDKKLVNRDDLLKAEKIAEKSKEILENVLVREKFIPEKELIKLKAYILGIPFVDLKQADIEPETLRIIPEPIARKNNIVAFKKAKDE